MEPNEIQQINDLKYFIKNHTSNAAIYELLAEEATELSFWASKVARIIREEVPTPVSLKEAFDKVDEEYGDVLNVACVGGITGVDLDKRIEKLKRWKQRIEERRDPK